MHHYSSGVMSDSERCASGPDTVRLSNLLFQGSGDIESSSLPPIPLDEMRTWCGNTILRRKMTWDIKSDIEQEE